MTYTETDRYIDSEYPADLTAKLRAADISNTDVLPAWAVRELQNNLLSDMPTFDPGNALAGRNPAAYDTFHAAYVEARSVKHAVLDTYRHLHGDDLTTRCRIAAADAVLEVCDEAMDAAVNTYIAAVTKGAP